MTVEDEQQHPFRTLRPEQTGQMAVTGGTSWVVLADVDGSTGVGIDSDVHSSFDTEALPWGPYVMFLRGELDLSIV